MSTISMPSASICSVWRSAASVVFHFPPSENESGVTFKMPMIYV